MTFDAFTTGNEARLLLTGLPMDRAPMLIDRTSGARITCQPTEVGGIPGMCLSFGYSSWPGRRPRQRDNAWVATVPIDLEADAAQLVR
jgi:hypothetical protein